MREDGVLSPGGLIEGINAQRIDFQDSDRAACLVAVAQALERFANDVRIVTVRLAPAEVAESIEQHLHAPGFSCACQVLRNATEMPPHPVPVLPIKGGLFVKLRGIDENDLVRLTIAAPGHVWRSGYESVDTVDVRVKE